MESIVNSSDRSIIPGAWPMSSRISATSPSCSYSVNTVNLRTQKRNSPINSSINGSYKKNIRPLSMPSYCHLQAHVNAIATLDSYGLDTNDSVTCQPKFSPSQTSFISNSSTIHSQKTIESQEPFTPTCTTWIPNVKIIKKFQSKIGITSEDKEVNLSPPHFHSVHGDNIQLIQNGVGVRRFPSQSYCKAIVFSDRPIRVNEKICIKVTGSTNEFVGGIRFGFTNIDPNILKHSLPDYAIPDLARKGFWIKAFHQYNLLKSDTILFYYVNQSGKIRFGVNEKKMGTFLKYVDTRRPLWAILDVYGNTTAIEFVDPKAHLNNSIKNTDENTKNIGHCNSGNGEHTKIFNRTFDSRISIRKSFHTPYSANPTTNDIQIHPTCGRNVQLNKWRNVAWRSTTNSCNGYIFTSRPINPGETIIVQIQQTNVGFNGSLAFGFTSANPTTINPKTLPDDSYFLIDRPEYWIFKKDVANFNNCDELAIMLNSSGTVYMSMNKGPTLAVMNVDMSEPLFGFFDLFGSTNKLILIGSILHDQLKYNVPYLY